MGVNVGPGIVKLLVILVNLLQSRVEGVVEECVCRVGCLCLPAQCKSLEGGYGLMQHQDACTGAELLDSVGILQENQQEMHGP